MWPRSAASGVNDDQSGRNPRSAAVLVCAGIGMPSPYLSSLITIGPSPGFPRCENGSGYWKRCWKSFTFAVRTCMIDQQQN